MSYFPSGTVIKNHLPMQRTQVQSLVQEDATCHSANKPVCHNFQSLCPQSQGSVTREDTTMRNQCTIMKSSSTCHNWRKPTHSNEDTAQPKKKNLIKKNSHTTQMIYRFSVTSIKISMAFSHKNRKKKNAKTCGATKDLE